MKGGGFVAKKGRPFYPVLTEVDPETGRRRQKWQEGYDRAREAKQRLAALLTARASGSYVERTPQTFGQFLTDEWLPAIRTTIRASTHATYSTQIRAHVVPRLGAVPLQKLRPAQLNAFYADLLESGRRDGKGGLSAQTVRYIHAVIHRALKDAVRWGRLPRNIAELADPPAPAPTERRMWLLADLRAFLRTIEDDRLGPCWLLDATTGMRRGELAGLRWEYLDLEAGRLTVRWTRVPINYQPHEDEPKTPRSRRTIDLDPATTAALRAHRRRQLEERFAWGEAWQDTGFVFTREDGSAIHPEALSESFERRVKAAGLPPITLHGLRHTYATLALEAGMKPWDLADRLGHSSTRVTLDVYRHAVPSAQREAAEKVAGVIFGENGGSLVEGRGVEQR